MKNKLCSALLILCLICSLFITSCGGQTGSVISLDEIPEYSQVAYVSINGGVPFFSDEEITDEAFERYSELDSLGRCGVAFACVGPEIMPDDPRESSLSTEPSGWRYNGKSNNNKYDSSLVSNGYVYNRCHLIGYQLTGEGDNEKNLITGTRYMNIEGMLPFENKVDDYIEETGNHVMYRVTPIFDDLNMVASGVLMEGYSVEDGGEGVLFCVYAYNVQPGISINYFNGTNCLSSEGLPEDNSPDGGNKDAKTVFYINTSSDKVHLESCRFAKPESMTRFEGTVEEFKIRFPNCTQCGTCKSFGE